MELNWIQSIIFGLISGLTDILPVSAQAHRSLLLKLFGVESESPVLRFLIHLATLAALYYCSSNYIMRISRQLRLSRIPKKRRKRPVDTRTIMDFRLLRTMLIPMIAGFFLYPKISVLNYSLNWIALFLFLNAVILYLPILLPSGNKDSRSLTPLEGVLMGLCHVSGIVPGLSGIGAVTSISSICGAEKSYSFNIAVLAHMAFTLGMLVFDLVAMVQIGVGTISFVLLLCYLLAAVAAFIGVFAGIRIMRMLAVNIGFNAFAYYCLGIALISFILFLTSG